VRRRPSARRGRRGGHLHRSQPRGVHEVGHPPALTLSAGPPEVLEQPVGIAGAYEGENGSVAASGFGSNGRELVESRAEPPVAARCALGGGGGYSHGGTVRRYLHAPRREGRARGRREILVSVLSLEGSAAEPPRRALEASRTRLGPCESPVAHSSTPSRVSVSSWGNRTCGNTSRTSSPSRPTHQAETRTHNSSSEPTQSPNASCVSNAATCSGGMARIPRGSCAAAAGRCRASVSMHKASRLLGNAFVEALDESSLVVSFPP
jgi:hypothetical protein